jgi:hypothetical protein
MRNAGFGVGSQRACEEFKGGNCDLKEEDGVVIEGLADLSSCGIPDLYA